MCSICDGQSYADNFAQMRERISRHGWTIQGVEGEVDKEGVHQSFAYTVGFTRHGLPEILLTGRNFDEASAVLNELGGAIRRGLRLAPETQMTAGGFDLFLLPVVRTQDLLYSAHYLYGNRPISALQAVWADPDGNFPWEQRYPDDITQPMACRP